MAKADDRQGKGVETPAKGGRQTSSRTAAASPSDAFHKLPAQAENRLINCG